MTSASERGGRRSRSSSLPQNTLFVLTLVLLGTALGENAPRHNDIPKTPSFRNRGLMNPHATIPQILWFYSHRDILVLKQPEDLYEIVSHTVKVYREAWESPGAPVNFVDTSLMCIKSLEDLEPDLIQILRDEKDEDIKEHICMAAILHRTGGYWVTKEATVFQAYIPAETTTLASTLECGTEEGEKCALPAFVASKRNHPLLKQMLRNMLDAYKWNRNKHLLGPRAMAAAYNSLPPEEQANVHLFQEASLDTERIAAPNLLAMTLAVVSALVFFGLVKVIIKKVRRTTNAVDSGDNTSKESQQERVALVEE